MAWESNTEAEQEHIKSIIFKYFKKLYPNFSKYLQCWRTGILLNFLGGLFLTSFVHWIYYKKRIMLLAEPGVYVCGIWCHLHSCACACTSAPVRWTPLMKMFAIFYCVWQGCYATLCYTGENRNYPYRLGLSDFPCFCASARVCSILQGEINAFSVP